MADRTADLDPAETAEWLDALESVSSGVTTCSSG
jgi:pyruvate dehydrogenase complex dehydrogenase (E1) component